jgi:hypothetical protein
MKGKDKKPYEPPKIVDLKVDYTQAVGQSRCLTGTSASGQCNRGNSANQLCMMGHKASGPACVHGAAPF